MRISWVTFDAFSHMPGGGLTSNYASLRLRSLIPAQDLTKRGHKVTFVPVISEKLGEGAIGSCMNADVVVFPKAFLAVHAQLADIAHDAGAKVVFDVCDNQFAGHLYAQNAREMAKRADLITCNTDTMAAIAGQHSKAPCVVIGDPYEGRSGDPRFAPNADRLKLLWYGHESHLNDLCDDIPDLARAAERIPLALKILSTPEKGMKELCAEIRSHYGNRFTATFVPWSLESQWQALEETDVVVITTRPTELTHIKSSNRMVSALRSGRMVVAHSLPSYEEFSQWAWVGENLNDGLSWTLDNQALIPRRIAAAQKAIKERLAPNVIGKKWELALRKLVAGKMQNAQT